MCNTVEVNNGLSIKVVSSDAAMAFHKLTSPFVSIFPLFVPSYYYFGVEIHANEYASNPIPGWG